MLQVQEQKRMGGEKFHVKRGSLSFSVDTVTLTLAPGEGKEGSFVILGAGGRPAAGFVLSSQIPMKVLTPSFSGSREVIGYRFEAAGFDPGETIDGAFRIISNNGEYELPFHVTVNAKSLDSSLGPIHNLIHFTNLARVNWQEAVSLFYRKEFARVLEKSTVSSGSGTDTNTAPSGTGGNAARRDHAENLLTLYRGLSVREGNEHNVEEFLIGAGQKQPVTYTADSREITMDLSAQDRGRIIRQIRIRRNGWGYTGLRAESDAEFLFLDRTEFSDADFQGGMAVLTAVIDPSRLHSGRNFGAVTLVPAYGDPIRIPVTVSWCLNTALRTLHRKEEHGVRAQMMKAYIRLRAREINGKEFNAQMASLIRRLGDLDRNSPLTALYRIHYLLTVHDDNDALWELHALNRNLSGAEEDDELPMFPIARFDLEDDVTYAYRMYLTSLCAEAQMDPGTASAGGKENGNSAPFSYRAAGSAANPGVIRDTIRAIEEMHRRNPDNFWITWLLLYADPDYANRPAQEDRMLREQYRRGSRSPILYMEAYQLFRSNPSMTAELDEYTLQVLNFAVRHKMLTDTVIIQLTSLAQRQKTFSGKLFRILAAVYVSKDTPDLRRRDVLESICSLLIRGNMTDSRYFPWYQRGVEQGLNITRLMDYFMLSLPADYHGDLPQMVLMYFAWQSSLPYGPSAYLYRYVCEHREESPVLYSQYEAAIDQFTLSQMAQARISPDLAYLYQRYLTAGRVLANETAGAFVPVIFSCAVHTDRTDTQRLVLVYDHFISEQYCPLQQGTAYLPIYGEAVQLFLEDNAGNRFRVSAPDSVVRMMDYGTLAERLSVYETSNAWYDLYLLGRAGTLSADLARRAQKLFMNPEVPAGDRRSLLLQLIQYDESTDDTQAMKRLLSAAEPDGMGPDARAAVLRQMVLQGFEEKAYRWVCRFGTDGISGDILLRMITGILAGGLTDDRGRDSGRAFVNDRSHDSGRASVNDRSRDEREPFADDGTLTQIAFTAFEKGSYNETILRYLSNFGDGLTGQLDAVRTACLDFDTDAYNISRRELIQMLFSGEDVPDRAGIVEECRRNGMEPEFLADVLAQTSHFCFVDRKEMADSDFALIGRYGLDGVPLLDICRIAWLQKRAEQQGEAAGQDLEVTGLFLSDLLAGGIVFPFFRQFIGVVPGMQNYADETLVEYRRPAEEDPDAKILYHYAMEKDGTRGQYAAKEMKEMYEDVYVTGFLLFFGEQMHYYITDDPGEKNVVESGTLSQDARIANAVNDRFGDINGIATMVALGRDEEAVKRLEAYGRKAYLVKRLFAGGKDVLSESE